MKIFIAADHRGFQLKNNLRDWLIKEGYDVTDNGAKKYDPDDDYPDFALAAAKAVAHQPAESLAILICGSGIGMAVAANKVNNIRAALVNDPMTATSGRSDDNINAIALSADQTSLSSAKEILSSVLNTPFSTAARHLRRINKISQFEKNHAAG